MNRYDYLIVGSGLFGATFAHLAKLNGKRCLVIEKRPHFGGNIYCEEIEGINVHKYGPHIFHTNDKEVWDFVRQFAEFNHYVNSPVANYKGEYYSLPFNMNTFRQLWGITAPEEAKAMLQEQQDKEIAKLKGKDPQNLEEQALCMLGKDIYEKLVKEYSEKQWGRDCKNIPAFVIKRLPVRFVYNNNYFNDSYQGIPIGGYNVIIEKMLAGIDKVTECDFFSAKSEEIPIDVYYEGTLRDNWQKVAKKLVFTGPLDEYFDYQLGYLDWRSVSFDTKVMDISNYQGNAVINYTSHDVPYTRSIEHKHFEMFGDEVFRHPKTVVSFEYSKRCDKDLEPFYPINNERNNALVKAYNALASRETDVIFGGRLAEYKYYDMAPVIRRAMDAVDKEMAIFR